VRRRATPTEKRLASKRLDIECCDSAISHVEELLRIATVRYEADLAFLRAKRVGLETDLVSLTQEDEPDEGILNSWVSEEPA
jgi:hypothetical protein